MDDASTNFYRSAGSTGRIGGRRRCARGCGRRVRADGDGEGGADVGVGDVIVGTGGVAGGHARLITLCLR